MEQTGVWKRGILKIPEKQVTTGNSEMPQHIHVVYVRGGTQTQEKHGKAEGGSHLHQTELKTL